MTLTDYYLLRRQKKIRLRQLAQYCTCSISQLSRYENNLIQLDSQKVKRYQEFITNYQVEN